MTGVAFIYEAQFAGQNSNMVVVMMMMMMMTTTTMMMMMIHLGGVVCVVGIRMTSSHLNYFVKKLFNKNIHAILN